MNLRVLLINMQKTQCVCVHTYILYVCTVAYSVPCVFNMNMFHLFFHSQVTITVEPPNSSVDSAFDGEESDEEPSSMQYRQRPKRKRNSDSMDSGDLSDTESQPSSLHLAEMDELPLPQSSQTYNQFSVVSCVADDAELPLQRNLHTIIVDCAPITFIDSVGAEVMEQVSWSTIYVSMVIGCLLEPKAVCGCGECEVLR